MRVLHLTIAAIQIATALALPARPAQGDSTPDNDDSSSSADHTKEIAGLALLGLGGAAYGLFKSHTGGSSPSVGNDKRYNRDAWTKSKQVFVAFCKFHEVQQKEQAQNRKLSEVEKQEIEEKYADMFDKEVAKSGSSGAPPVTRSKPSLDQKKNRVAASFKPLLERIKHAAGSAINRVNQDHAVVGGSLPYNVRPPAFRGVL